MFCETSSEVNIVDQLSRWIVGVHRKKTCLISFFYGYAGMASIVPESCMCLHIHKGNKGNNSNCDKVGYCHLCAYIIRSCFVLQHKVGMFPHQGQSTNLRQYSGLCLSFSNPKQRNASNLPYTLLHPDPMYTHCIFF